MNKLKVQQADINGLSFLFSKPIQRYVKVKNSVLFFLAIFFYWHRFNLLNILL